MKFPQDKKKRMQIFACVGIFVLAGLYGIFQYVVMPLVKSFDSCKNEIVELRKQIADADKETKKIRGLKKESADTRARLREVDAKYVLKSEFANIRNFEIGAREKADGAFKEAGIKMGPADSVGADGEQTYGRGGAFQAFVISIGVRPGMEDPLKGYAGLTNLLMAFEGRNPYATVTDLSIDAVNEKPGVQSVSFRVRWPVWAQPDIVTNFAIRADDDQEDVPPSADGGARGT